jgi:hypothetical protein
VRFAIAKFAVMNAAQKWFLAPSEQLSAYRLAYMKAASSRGTGECEWPHACYQDDFLNLYRAAQAAIRQQPKIEYEPPREVTPELAIVLRKLDEPRHQAVSVNGLIAQSGISVGRKAP